MGNTHMFHTMQLGDMRPSDTIYKSKNIRQVPTRNNMGINMRGNGRYTPNVGYRRVCDISPQKRKRKKIQRELLYEDDYDERAAYREKNYQAFHKNQKIPRKKLRKITGDSSKDTQDITSFFEGSSRQKYLDHLPNLEPGSQNLLMDKNFISNHKKNKEYLNKEHQDTESRDSSVEHIKRKTKQGMNLYDQEYSEDENEDYESERRGSEEISDESQLVDQTELPINELPESENHSDISDKDNFENDDLKDILEDMDNNSFNNIPKPKKEQDSFEKMKNSNFRNLRTNKLQKFGTLKQTDILREKQINATNSHKKTSKRDSYRPIRKESYRKQGLYYSNEKPNDSRILAKSYKFDGCEENWDAMDEMGDSKILYADDMNPNLQNKVSKILDHLPGTNQHQILIKNQTRKYMNILLVGKAFRGKSDLLKQIFQDAFGRRIELQAEKVKKGNFELISHEKKTQEFIINYTFTDSRGFLSGLAVEKWFLNIKKYLNQCMNEYYKLQCVLDKDPSLKFKGIADNRMHLCVYLLQFPRLTPNDYIYLKKLESYVNVLPVVVMKAEDQHRYSLSEIEKMKNDIYMELNDLNMDCLQWTKQDGIIGSLQKKLIGKTFPAVVQLRDLQENMHRNRNLNSDFHIVIKMLTNPYISLFQWRTEQYYTSRIPKILKGNKKKEGEERGDDSDENEDGNEKFGFGAGVAVGLGIIGAFMAFKNKLF